MLAGDLEEFLGSERLGIFAENLVQWLYLSFANSITGREIISGEIHSNYRFIQIKTPTEKKTVHPTERFLEITFDHRSFRESCV